MSSIVENVAKNDNSYFPHLGLRAAEMTALPSDIIQEANTIASRVSQQFLVCTINVL